MEICRINIIDYYRRFLLGDAASEAGTQRNTNPDVKFQTLRSPSHQIVVFLK